jgi:hypothetical protein
MDQCFWLVSPIVLPYILKETEMIQEGSSF